MSKNWTVRNGKPAIKGLFVKGIWHCDCDTRLPAEKFQVKNGGQNHGRWFFTCQKPQQKRCSFFLWADDAKIREESAVLSNSRDEQVAQNIASPDKPVRTDPQTPKRNVKTQQLITPSTGAIYSAGRGSASRSTNKGAFDLSDGKFLGDSPQLRRNFSYDDFDWSSDAEEELAVIAESLDSQQTVQANNDEDESPRKIAKISEFSSPTKRTHQEMSHQPSFSDATSTSAWLTGEDDYLETPSTSTKSTYLLSPEVTPLRRRLFQNETPQQGNETVVQYPETSSSLAESVLAVLSPVRASLSKEAEQALVALLNKHEMQTLGVIKGRDIARLAIKTKEQKIKELQAQIIKLEHDNDMGKAVINHLKSDIMTSPKKPRRPGESAQRRSQV